MKTCLIKFCFLALILLGLPLAGVLLAGRPVDLYLEFPPQTRFVDHAPFSWSVFMLYCVLILLTVLPFIIRVASFNRTTFRRKLKRDSFPWWGWVGLLIGLIAWLLAWTRFSWFTRFQPYTYIPLWLSFILVINAVTYRRDGHCMMIDRPFFFVLLFPVSAAFWWFFEYLNRFVQNWYYVGEFFDPWIYFLNATFSFSTVLPAVLGTREWLIGIPTVRDGFKKFASVPLVRSRMIALIFLMTFSAGLSFIGIWPDYFFSLLWVAPLFIILSLQILTGEIHVLSGIERGDWSLIVSSALAALICGWFWEMWNYWSLARWEYAIPFVHRFKIFEMPVLGYAGYIPFGIECAAIGQILGNCLEDRI